MGQLNARRVEFDNEGTLFESTDVWNAIQEAQRKAEGKPRAVVAFWDWNAYPIWLYLFGQTRSDDVPFGVASDAILRELSCSGGQNNTTANAMFAVYATMGGAPVTNQGTLATASRQGLTWAEGDFPYAGTTRVTVEIVNNGPSLPLVFSEDLVSRTVTIQLATDGSGNVTTRRRDLRDAFRLNTTITLLYYINGGNNTLMVPDTFQLSGGDAGDVVASVFMRATGVGFRSGYEVELPQGTSLRARAHSQVINSFSPTGLSVFLSWGVN